MEICLLFRYLFIFNYWPCVYFGKLAFLLKRATLDYIGQ